MTGERRAALEREKAQSHTSRPAPDSFRPRIKSIEQSAPASHLKGKSWHTGYFRIISRSSLGASGATLALLAGIALAPPASAEPLSTVVSLAAANQPTQQLTVSSVVEAASLNVNDPVASAIAGVIASSGGAAGVQAAQAIVSSLAVGGERQRIIATAMSYLGDPYVLGGASHEGIDCSGLVMMAYQSVGIQLDHLVSAQDAAGVTIPEAEAQPGDLVVFDDNEHIAIYLGNGVLIQAPKAGENVEIKVVWQGIPHHFVRILPD